MWVWQGIVALIVVIIAKITSRNLYGNTVRNRKSETRWYLSTELLKLIIHTLKSSKNYLKKFQK